MMFVAAVLFTWTIAAAAQTGSIVGTVIGEYDQGQPVCRVRLVVLQDSVLSDKHFGTFGFHGLQPGRDTLAVSHRSWEKFRHLLNHPVVIKPDTITVVDIGLADRRHPTPRTSYLPMPADLFGCVIDSATRQELPDVSVRVIPASEAWRDIARSRTDEHGAYQFLGLNPGAYRLMFTYYRPLEFGSVEKRIELRTHDSATVNCELPRRVWPERDPH